MNLNTKAILEVATAYKNRGVFLQYDQRCMDRTLFLTPRRIKKVPPEFATEQNTLFLDCSSFVGAVFYEAFGYEIPYDLTWHMVKYLKPRLYYYEKTFKENSSEREKVINDIRNILKIGDVITYDRGIGSGHTMIYMGDGKIMHCASNGRPNSYDYENKKSREYEDGGLFVTDIFKLLENVFFKKDDIQKIAIERVLDKDLKPTENTLLRMTNVKDLVFSVTASHHGGIIADEGDIIEYTLSVKNCGEGEKEAEISFDTPSFTEYKGDRNIKINILKGEEKKIVFSAKLLPDAPHILDSPKICVNSFCVYAPRVLTGRKTDVEDICVNVVKRINGGEKPLLAASGEYEKRGIKFSDEEDELLLNLFYIHDSTSGDMLTRKKQNPPCDMGLYSYFGGTGVSTPEMISNPHIRCTKVLKRDLFAGDIILVSKTPYGDECTAFFYDGDKIYSDKKVIENNEICEFTDSLLGEFAFIILRPSLLRKEKENV